MAVPDFSGFWVRVGNLWFDPIFDDDEGKPVSRLKLNRPDAEDIWAGDFDNPVLQPRAREIVKKKCRIRNPSATCLHGGRFLLAFGRTPSREPARRD